MKDTDVDENEDHNVFNLLSQLQKEKLFIKNEKLNIQKLNEEIKLKTESLIKSTWITTKQRLYLLDQREVTILNYKHIKDIVNADFVEAKSVLKFQCVGKIETLLQFLRTHPEQLAKWLFRGEQLTNDESVHFNKVLQSIVTGLYSSCLFPEDTTFMLKLLYELAKLQLVKSGDNPRKILKQNTCAFRNLYFIFNEVLPTAKVFLSAALEIPILRLLSHREMYLDIDPNKSLMRYKQDDHLKNEFKNYQEHREEVVRKLSEFANGFVHSLRENIYSFPKSIAWIVHKIAKIIGKSFGAKESNAIVTELIFTLYICPAIVDPEQYSISDSHLTEIGQHNLIQIAQILQVLALNKFETTDGRFNDIYSLFDKDTVANFMEDVLFNLDHEDEPPVDITPSVLRDWVLFEENELNYLVLFLQKVEELNNDINGGENLNKTIEEQISSLILPSSLDSSPKSAKPYTNGFSGNDAAAALNATISTLSVSSLKKATFLTLVTKNHAKQDKIEDDNRAMQVIIFSIDKAIPEPVGLMSEEKVLKRTTSDLGAEVMIPQVNNAEMSQVVVGNGEDKNYQDEGSIGNTSDNLEAISEAASNHSVASSLELENEDQNDNLSDMISANVSGRGTPNISGRDTPSSQVNENEERPIPEARPIDIAPAQPAQISRQIRSEIDDKFCKFEIKKLLEGDETISIISETWSTDVLASDNEAVEMSDSRLERMSLPLVEQAINEVPTGNILDLSETQSESAWSTDVMASDTERLQEVENDDAGSVAQSDDTNSVARSDDTRSETDENVAILGGNGGGIVNNLRKLSSASSSTFYTEYRKVEMLKNERKCTSTTTTTTQTVDNVANNVVMKSLTELKSSYNTNRVMTTKRTSVKDGAGPSGCFSNHVNNNNNSNNNNNLNGQSNSGSLMKQANYDERPSEILLSNCSLNSSSSGSSSSNSFENKHQENNCHHHHHHHHHSHHNHHQEQQWERKQWLNSSGSSLNVTSTPSESTSELSVLSVNNSAMNPIRKTTTTHALNGGSSTGTCNSRSLKPSASTGAIPKTITFDVSADKGYLDDDPMKSKRQGFFGKIKMGFKSRSSRGKSSRSQSDFLYDGPQQQDDYNKNESPIKLNNSEVSEHILAKYRSKSFMESSPLKAASSKGRKAKKSSRDSEEMDVDNSFDDIKKKLRIVLSDITSQSPKILTEKSLSAKSKLETILRLELGRNRKLKEWSKIARISEALRVINSRTENTCMNLLQSMQDDYVKRSSYIQYLIGSRQELLFCHSYLDDLNEQILHEKDQCDEYLSMICVRQFLIEQEVRLSQFYEEFKEINLSDEKCDYLNNLYKQLYSIMQTSVLWQDIFQNRCDIIKITLERCIISKVYDQALYPNGDGDRHRDFVLYQHIEKLSSVISPTNKYLMIPKMYLRELPWIPAQDALNAIGAYRTPRDKVNCVVHCAKCIMDLLAFSQSSGARSADDFTPVLVYVIIKVNPANLLSTIQFVNSFYMHQLQGEEEYWWTHFCSAVEFIKTMDYSD